MAKNRHVQRPDDTTLHRHFKFGENWSSFAKHVESKHVESAVTELQRLLRVESGNDSTFLDIGCGSGLHSVAAAKLGYRVTAIDLDPQSVATTAELARKFAVHDRISLSCRSVLDLEPDGDGFDIVYSWGVLHHTGEMWESLRRASTMMSTKTSSQLVVALYRKTRLCAFWRLEKRAYMRSPEVIQRIMRAVFGALHDLSLVLRLRNPKTFRTQYFEQRGMSFNHDVHDWLGGYPYESVSPDEMDVFATKHNFVITNSNVRSRHRVPLGVFGSGCDEYVFKLRDPL